MLLAALCEPVNLWNSLACVDRASAGMLKRNPGLCTLVTCPLGGHGQTLQTEMWAVKPTTTLLQISICPHDLLRIKQRMLHC